MSTKCASRSGKTQAPRVLWSDAMPISTACRLTTHSSSASSPAVPGSPQATRREIYKEDSSVTSLTSRARRPLEMNGTLVFLQYLAAKRESWRAEWDGECARAVWRGGGVDV